VSGYVFREGNEEIEKPALKADLDNRMHTMRRLENYVKKYGPVAGPKLFHALQSQAAHAGVSVRLRKKIDALSGKSHDAAAKPQAMESLPLFPERVEEPVAEAAEFVACA
jgi:hypothetical protein